MINEIESIFGIKIETPELYKIALSHSSYIQEQNLDYTQCYERLEFLGDAVLKLSVSDIIFNKYPQDHEGELSKIRSYIVSDHTLSIISKEKGLNKLILLAKHEEKQGCRELESICACSFEALLGAYYLDGKFAEIKEFLKQIFTPFIIDVKNHFENYNAKAILQEYTQSIDSKRPEYIVLNSLQHKNHTEFEIEVRYNNEILAVEKGFSKKEAEQKCAYSACKKLGII